MSIRSKFATILLFLSSIMFSLPGISVAHTVSPPATQALTPIKHIVILTQENHSEDNELGYFCIQTGRCQGPPQSVTLADGNTVTLGATPDIVPTVDHNMVSQELAQSNQWDQIKGCGPPTYYCLTYYQPSPPNLTSLAAQYTILSNAYTLANSPSWGGHLDLLAGTTAGFTGDNPSQAPGQPVGDPKSWGCDAYRLGRMLPVDGLYIKPQPSCVPDYNLNPAQYPYGGAWEPTLVHPVTTILQEMDAANVSWKIYAATYGQGGGFWSACPSYASCIYTSEYQNLVSSNHYFDDAFSGNLPDVSFVMPAGDNNAAFSQHNTQSNAAGDNWVGRVVSAAMTGPEASSTAIIVTYDDCGCFYGQFGSNAPDGRQMGTSVPFIIISPYALPGYTDATETSSTGSILAFIEANFGLSDNLGQNVSEADNLMQDFNFAQTNSRIKFPRMVWQKLPAWKYRVTVSTSNDPT